MPARWKTPPNKKDVEYAFVLVRDALVRRLAQHGPDPYYSPHHAYGILAEEANKELLDAIHANDEVAFTREMIDVAVTAVWSLASVAAQVRAEDGKPHA